MAVVYIMATVQGMSHRIRSREHPREKEFEALLVDVFRRAGWSIHESLPADSQDYVVVESKGQKYVIQVKQSAEGRRDRLVPCYRKPFCKRKWQLGVFRTLPFR